jgi:hypothetical protein
VSESYLRFFLFCYLFMIFFLFAPFHLFCVSFFIAFPPFFCLFFIALPFSPSFSPLFFCFLFLLLWVLSLSYHNLPWTKRLGCCTKSQIRLWHTDTPTHGISDTSIRVRYGYTLDMSRIRIHGVSGKNKYR